jgi:hypothetical protein
MKKWVCGLAIALLAIALAGAAVAQTTGAGDKLTLIYVSTTN